MMLVKRLIGGVVGLFMGALGALLVVPYAYVDAFNVYRTENPGEHFIFALWEAIWQGTDRSAPFLKRIAIVLVVLFFPAVPYSLILSCISLVEGLLAWKNILSGRSVGLSDDNHIFNWAALLSLLFFSFLPDASLGVSVLTMMTSGTFFGAFSIWLLVPVVVLPLIAPIVMGMVKGFSEGVSATLLRIPSKIAASMTSNTVGQPWAGIWNSLFGREPLRERIDRAAREAGESSKPWLSENDFDRYKEIIEQKVMLEQQQSLLDKMNKYRDVVVCPIAQSVPDADNRVIMSFPSAPRAVDVFRVYGAVALNEWVMRSDADPITRKPLPDATFSSWHEWLDKDEQVEYVKHIKAVLSFVDNQERVVAEIKRYCGESRVNREEQKQDGCSAASVNGALDYVNAPEGQHINHSSNPFSLFSRQEGAAVSPPMAISHARISP